MSGFTLNVAFDAASLEAVGRMARFPSYYGVNLYIAGLASLERLEMEAYRYMWATFKNPTGQIEDSLGYQMDSPTQGWMGTDSAYGRRLNYSFTGMTDALGRYFAEWPRGDYSDGYHWAEYSIEASSHDIVGYYKTAIERTILDLGGVP